MQLTRKFKGLFWTPQGGAADAVHDRAGDAPEDASPEDASDKELEALAAEAAAKVPGRPASVAAQPSGPAGPAVVTVDGPSGDIDLAAIYARTNSYGDPRVDQVLTAFEAMKAAMPAPQLAVAIGATAKAIGAEPSSIVEVLTQRMSALDTTVADEQRKALEREAARTAELEATARKVQMEIDAMEQKIAAFRRQLGAATESVRQKTTHERGVIAAFGAKARGEADRLKALRDFLAPPGMGSPASPVSSSDKPGKK